MPDSLDITEEIKRYTVKIIDETNNEILGTGIILSQEGNILTCYHVVFNEKSKAFHQNLLIGFPGSNDTKHVTLDKGRCDPNVDIAFLRLNKAESLPSNTSVANLSEIIDSKHNYRSFGFKQPHEIDGLFTDPQPIKGLVQPRDTENNILPELIELPAKDIDHGMSGSAVVDIENNRVIGIVSELYAEESNLLNNFALAIPTKSVIYVFPELKDLNPGLNPFLRLPELRQYLTNIVNEFKTKFGQCKDKRKSLYDCYINQDVVLFEGKKSLKIDDHNIRSLHKNIETIGKTIEDIVKEERSRLWYKIVGTSSFGLGKTSLVMFIAHDYAQRYIDDPNASKFIPIPIFLKEENALGPKLQDWLDKILSSIPGSELLLLVDGLEEYNEGTKKLMEELDKIKQNIGFVRKNENTKAILTTNLSSDISSNVYIYDYVRLLPFTESQVNDFFKRYGVEQLTYKKALKYGIRQEEITTPLFAWMLSFINTDFRIFNKLWTKDGKWNDNIRKTLIYMLFFFFTIKEIVEGQLDESDENSWKTQYLKEKQTLREIAVLTQLLGESLVVKEEQNKYNIRTLVANFNGITIDPIRPSMFFSYFDLLDSNKHSGKTIKFVHHTLQEYLLAEKYIESLLSDSSSDRTFLLNLGIPSKVTIQFLDGLIGLLMIANDKEILKYVEGDTSSLLNSLGYSTNQSSIARYLLEKNAKSCFEDESIILFKQNNDIISFDKSGIKAKINSDTFKGLWIHRWISLHFLSRVSSSRYDIKDSLQTLISFTANIIPGYIKKLRFDLSDINLRVANLGEADLSGANLKYTDLSNANLGEADLSGTDFSHANMFACYLSVSNLDYANFRLTHLIKSNLSYSDLYFANLFGTNLELSDLRWANMSQSNLQFANLIGVDLSYADLSNSKLIDINNFSDLKCDNAIFNGAITNNIQLIEYLEKMGISDLPKLVTDNSGKEELKEWNSKFYNEIEKRKKPFLEFDSPL